MFSRSTFDYDSCIVMSLPFVYVKSFVIFFLSHVVMDERKNVKTNEKVFRFISLNSIFYSTFRFHMLGKTSKIFSFLLTFAVVKNKNKKFQSSKKHSIHLRICEKLFQVANSYNFVSRSLKILCKVNVWEEKFSGLLTFQFSVLKMILNLRQPVNFVFAQFKIHFWSTSIKSLILIISKICTEYWWWFNVRHTYVRRIYSHFIRENFLTFISKFHLTNYILRRKICQLFW